MRKHVGEGQLGGKDGVLELELGQVLADGSCIPIYFAFSDQLADSCCRERLGDRSDRLQRLPQ